MKPLEILLQVCNKPAQISIKIKLVAISFNFVISNLSIQFTHAHVLVKLVVETLLDDNVN